MQYTFDSVDGESASIMEDLIRQGWKNLQYVAHNSWGDVRAPEICGDRPMSDKEILTREKLIADNRKKEIKVLRSLAKKLGYKVTPLVIKGIKK